VGKSGRRIYRKSYFKEKALIYNATIHKKFSRTHGSVFRHKWWDCPWALMEEFMETGEQTLFLFSLKEAPYI
jgi:hypothetical protein